MTKFFNIFFENNFNFCQSQERGRRDRETYPKGQRISVGFTDGDSDTVEIMYIILKKMTCW